MPITEQDIKLYKSSVMLDVPEGGGPMSGQVVPDGVSNNLYPDTSEIDRSLGRVQFRSVFGVAETPDTDTLLGTHALIISPPADPLVHAALIKPVRWGGTVTDYKAQVERYLLKGVRITSRLLDVHYAGSVALQLVSMSGTDFPAANDVMVLVHPDGVTPDQYVRALKVAVTQRDYTVVDGGGVVTFTAYVAQVELSLPLASDQPGPPVSRAVADEAIWTKLYSTTRASGANFYGIRPLAAEAALGALTATVDTVYHPIVPAAQVETPLVDVYPYASLSAVARTGLGLVTLPPTSMPAGPGTVWTLPSAIEAGTLQIAHGGTTFTDYLGVLRDGPTPVGTVDYVLGTATLGSAAPNYGTGSSAITYKPGTRTSGVMHSRDVTVTTANSGIAWVQDMEPKPMPGSVRVEYMAQGAWYTLSDVGGAGKLVGASTAHGTGTVSYASGSLAMTLGAIPDTDSSILLTWATAESAVTPPGPFPARATCTASLTVSGGAPTAVALPTALAWTVGGAARSAVVTLSTISGGATGQCANGALTDFAPAEVPDAGSLTWTGTTFTPPVSGTLTAPSSGMTFDVGATDLSGLSGKAKVSVTPITGNWAFDPEIDVHFAGSVVVATAYGNAIGSVNLATGIVTLNNTVTLDAPKAVAQQTGTLAGQTVNNYYTYDVSAAAECTVNGFSPTVESTPGLRYWGNSSTAPGSGTGVLADKWTVFGAFASVSSSVPVQATGVLLGVFGTVLTVAGLPRLGWSALTGSATGYLGSFEPNTGALTVDNPPVGSSTELTVYNLSQRTSSTYLTSGVIRSLTAPLKPGSMQLSSNGLTASVSDTGAITGDFEGQVDFYRGIVRWHRTTQSDPGFAALWANYPTATVEGATPDSLSYNAVFLQYLPLDAALLGLDTSRLPLDGRVPYVRTGDTAVVHHTATATMPNPVTLGTVQSLGRTRIAAVKVVDAAGAKVASDRYTTDLDTGTLTFTGSLALYAQPLTVHHRIEDMMLVSKVDISGAVSFTRPLTHTFPAGQSYLSSALRAGDVQARAYGQFEQVAWTGEWADTATGAAILANYNEVANPIGVTNGGAIPERWACIFTNSTTFRVVGEAVGEIATGSTTTSTAPVNPATMVPYFTLASAGWGTGWAAGNVMRFNTDAAGANFVVVRTVLQGPATVASDQFEIAFRGDVNA